MKTILAILIFLIFFAGFSFAQNLHFVTSGNITYEKTINMFAIIKSQMDMDDDVFGAQMYEQYKKNQPQFKKVQSVLTFGNNKALYKPIVSEYVQAKAF